MERRLDLLGVFAMSRDGAAVSLRARKSQILLGLLSVARRRTLPRSKLCGLLWGTTDGESARASLRQATAQIRRAGGDGWLRGADDQIALEPDVLTDVDVFLRALARGDAAEAIRLYTGPFLDGAAGGSMDLQEALDAERARFAGLAKRALSDELERIANQPEASRIAHRLLRLEPLNEQAHRVLMRQDATGGARAAALQRFDRLKAALAHELDAVPEEETVTLYHRIRRSGGRSADGSPKWDGPAQDAGTSPSPMQGGYVHVALQGDECADWTALRQALDAHGAKLLDGGVGEMVALWENGSLHEVANMSVALASAAGNLMSHGLAEITDGRGGDHRAALSNAVVRARKLAARGDLAEVHVDRSLGARLGLSLGDHGSVRLSPGALAERPQFPLIGRDLELAQINGAMASAARSGTALCVLVSGEAGIGKSALSAEVMMRAESEGATVAKLGFQLLAPDSRNVAQLIMASLPRAASGDAGDRVDDAVCAWLRGTTGDADAALLMSALTDDERRKRTLKLLARTVSEVAEDAGLVLLVEDFHWAPPGAGDFLLDLAERLAASRVTLLVTERPHSWSLGDRIAARGRVGIVRLNLSPLTPVAAEQLAAIAFPGRPGTDEVVKHAGGHPLFLLRLLEAGWSTGHLPRTVTDLVLEQIERLRPRQRHALQCVSILGVNSAAADVAAIFPEIAPPTATGDLLQLTERGFAFGHELVRQAIYEAVPAETRQTWHARAARHYEGYDPLLWADHALLSDDDAVACRAARSAANAMVAAMRFPAAMSYVEAGLGRRGDPEAVAELHFCRATILRMRADMHGALDDYRAAHAAATSDVTRVAALVRQALVLHRMEKGAEADRALDAAEDIAAAIGLCGAALAEIHEQRGNRAFVSGDHDACLRHHSAALKAAEADSATRAIARAHGGLGDAHYAAGRMATAYQHFDRAVTMAEDLGFGVLRAEYLFMRAFALFFARPGTHAHLLADLAVDSGVETGAARAEMLAREIRAEMRAAAGDLEGLRADIEAIEALTMRQGEPRFLKDLDLLRGLAHWMEGDTGSARTRVARLLPDADNDPYVGATILGLSALLAGGKNARNDAILRGEALIGRAALSHSVLWFYLFVLRRAIDDRDQALARRCADALRSYTRNESLGLVEVALAHAESHFAPRGHGRLTKSSEAILEARLQGLFVRTAVKTSTTGAE